MRRRSSYLLLSLAVLVLDQWSKWLVEVHLPGRGPLEVVPDFLDLIHVQNTGVAFGMFAANGHPVGTLLLTLLGLAALALVAVYFWRTPVDQKLLLSSLALILGGAVGNLLDRMATGAVTDFIDVYVGSYHWHTFNVADSAITVGIALMAIDVFFTRAGEGDPETASGRAAS